MPAAAEEEEEAEIYEHANYYLICLQRLRVQQVVELVRQKFSRFSVLESFLYTIANSGDFETCIYVVVKMGCSHYFLRNVLQ